jgi:hypothetical protein
MSDVVPQKGMSICSLTLWGLVTLITLTFPILMEAIGIALCFLMFAALTLIS